MKYVTRLSSGLVAILICLLATAAQAQQGSATTRPSTPPPNGSTNSQTAPPSPLDLRAKATERVVDESVKDDPAVDALIAPYSAKVHELGTTIGKLAGQLKKAGMGGGSLGNFVADALRDRAAAKLGKPVLLAITNSGGLRKSEITEGDISASDIFELLPFENALVTVDLTGEQLRRFLDLVVSRRDAQSGARITYRTNDKKQSEIVSIKLGDKNETARDIDPKATYTIVTIDYLVKRGGDYSFLQEAKNVRPLGLTMRDAVLEYVKAETAAGRAIKPKLDSRFRYDRNGSGKTEDEQPQ